jgi:hypothetical protein
MEKLLSAQHVADHLGIHVKTLYKQLRENRIPLDFVRKAGNRIAFRPSVVERFMADRDVTRDGSSPARKKKPKKYGYPSDPKTRHAMLAAANAPIMTDAEAQQFFAGMERDQDGNFISDPEKETR